MIYIYFPYLAAARIYRQGGASGQPMVFVQSVNGADQVMACCAAARRQGLGAGMRLADARALCPTLHSHSYDAARDRADLHHLALWARRYSPLTGVDERANGIWIDVAGAEHLFGDVRGLMVDCVRRLRRSGLRVRFAAAPTCGAAWALAHYARPGIHIVNQPIVNQYNRSFSGAACPLAPPRTKIQQILAPLPLAALRIDQDIDAALHRVGLHVIGDIMMMPRAPLATRFGDDLLRRLDQASGDIQESFSPLAPTQPMIVSRNFAEPIAAASDVVAMISYLADEMARLLYHTGMAARRLELGWQLVDGGRHRHNIHLSRPSRQSALFHRLLAGVSDRINPEFGIEAGWMQAHDCSPLAPLDQPLHHMAPSSNVTIDENYASLIDRLVAVRLQPQASWQPESAQQTRLPEMAMPASSVAGAGWLASAQSVTAPPRPIRLLAHPHPIDVVALLPDHPPAQFIWQRRTHKIVKATGPERIAPPWWAAPAGTKSRDYFRVQDHQGACFWLYRDGLPERGEMAAWFLHGFFA
ncbi:MAG: DNA polymerase Y family protein [Alphaproteobacteria bacterium]|nr:DNA polymerase Y family protein [Alphaproteobacteria bacterium]